LGKNISLLSIITLFSLFIKSFFVKYFVIQDVNIVGLLTELSFLTVIILPIVLCNKKNTVVPLILLNFLFTVLSITTIIYFDYYNSIFTYKSFNEMNQVGTIKDSIFALFEVRYLFLFSDIILLLFWKRTTKSIRLPEFNLSNQRTIIILFISAVFISTGIFHSKNTLSEINKYNNLGLAGYQLMEAAAQAGSVFHDEKITSAEELNLKKDVFLRGKKILTGSSKNKNVIIVQLEAVQKLLINSRIAGKEITPNLNKFVGSSFYFPNFYTQVGKGNTSDAEFIVNTSIYAMGETAMSSATEGKSVPSLPRLLRNAGYHTATFHANDVSFWNRDELYKSLGFHNYYDKKYFGENDIISYGASDEVLYKKTVEKLAEYRQNGREFYAQVIGMSSHFPYNIPDSKKHHMIDIPEKYKGSFVGSYIQAVSYADYAFGLFLEKLKNEGLYDESVIVVYGDHQGVQIKDETDREFIQELLGRAYHPVLDHLNVPLMIKIPSAGEAEKITTVGGLVDIYPTIANLLGLDITDEVIFGTDLINSKNNLIGIRFYAPTGTYINNSFSFSPGEKKDQGELTLLTNRKGKSANTQSLKQLERIMEILDLSDNYVKSLK
jgi:lipoteichoic acid synthase